MILSQRSAGGMVALDVETPDGTVEELVVSDIAREAIEFVARQSLFDVRAMPGNLSDEERAAIAEAIEDTGLFRRVQQ